jgi:hypothetical protein
MSDTRRNFGIIAAGADGRLAGRANPKTFVISGVARSGTTMVAGLMRRAGVFLGDPLHEVVLEDAQMLELLRNRRMDRLRQEIARRNTAHAVWGFKLPNLHAFLRAEELALFRSPHLILVFRDPVAVTVRSAISERYQVMEELASTAAAVQSLVQFATRAGCPVLMVSYEKALISPEETIDSLLSFCGIKVPAKARAPMLAEVQPNHPGYLAGSSSDFEGFVEGIRDGRLEGWCWQVGRLDPLRVDILANGFLLHSVLANRFREDLLSRGVGNGAHGFSHDLAAYRLPPETAIRARIRDRTVELGNSGTALGALPRLPPLEPV